LGCGDDDGAKPKEENDQDQEYPAAITISRAMDNFEKSYEEMDLEEYTRLLDESFEFIFDPRDVGEETHDRDRWPIEDELTSTGNMFGGEADEANRVAQRITMGFDRGAEETSPADPAWKRVILTAFALELEAIDQDDGQRWFLRTPLGYEVRLHFIQTEEIDPVTNSPLWKIIRMEDKPPVTTRVRTEPPSWDWLCVQERSPGTEESTWGRIKRYYR
jgi:hypothetical protein